MINPYPARIEELHEHLEAYWGQMDRQATEILLASLISEARRKPFIILETDYPNRDTADAWFSFGGVQEVKSMAAPRVVRARLQGNMLKEWLNGDRLVAVDAEWRRPPKNNQVNMLGPNKLYRTLLARCVKLRVTHPKRVIGAPAESMKQELARLTRRVIDGEFRPRASLASPSTLAPLATLGSAYPYWCELLQKVAPWQTDWETLTGTVADLATGVCRLYNPPIEAKSNEVRRSAERVMRDSISQTTAWILEQTSVGRLEGMKAFHRFLQGGVKDLEKAVKVEIGRLNEEAVIVVRANWTTRSGAERSSAKLDKRYKYQPWRYRLNGQDWHDLIDREKAILI